MEPINPKTGMTQSESREFIRNHFEGFVNRKNVDIGNVNFARISWTTALMFRRERRVARPVQSSMWLVR